MIRATAVALLLAAIPIAFTEVRDPRDWPPAVQEWVGAHRDAGGTGAVHDGVYTYLMAAAGQHRTGGYVLRFTEIVQSDGGIVGVVALSGPPPGGAVTMAITHPLAVVRIARTDLPIVIRRA